MNADKAAELVNRKRREYGMDPILLTQAQKDAAFKSLMAQASFKGVSLETAIESTVRMHKQSEMLGRQL